MKRNEKEFSAKRHERVKAFFGKLKTSMFSVDTDVLPPVRFVIALLCVLFELSLQGFVYITLMPANYAHLYIFSVFAIPLTMAMLIGPVPALSVGLVASVLIAAISKSSLWVFITAAAGPAMAALTARSISSSKMLAKVFILTWVFQIILASLALCQCFNFALEEHWNEIIAQLLAFTFYFILWALVFKLVYLPLAEKIFGTASSITLAKFGDLENKLFEELRRVAPGTYQHSRNVGDLAQRAAEAIGANALLARVGAYYHDIGKTLKPDFYMENQTGLSNPHDQLPPSISRLIIMNHVRDGLCLAAAAKLPKPILRFIETHHGTTVISWFYRKALKQSADKAAGIADSQDQLGNAGKITGLAQIREVPPPEYHYRYDGPLPGTREETIVSLADSIEAASRSLKSPTEESLAKLVDGIIKSKFEDGQLAQSELTAAEIEKTKVAFVEELKHLNHSRLAYPPKNDTDKH